MWWLLGGWQANCCKETLSFTTAKVQESNIPFTWRHFNKGCTSGVYICWISYSDCPVVHDIQGCSGAWISLLGITFQSLYPFHTHRKTCDNPHRIHIPTEPRSPPYPSPIPCVLLLDAFLYKHICAVYVMVLLCVFLNDNEEKMPVKNYKLDCVWRNSDK